MQKNVQMLIYFKLPVINIIIKYCYNNIYYNELIMKCDKKLLVDINSYFSFQCHSCWNIQI